MSVYILCFTIKNCCCVLRAIVSRALMKPITETPDVSDLKNGSSRSYAEAMKELALYQRLLKPQNESSKLQLSSVDHEASISYIFK